MVMDPSIWISLIAIGISLLALWKSHLEPFALQVTNSNPNLTIYPMTSTDSGTTVQGESDEGPTWWIPSFDVGLSFYNLGQRVGVVEGIRIAMDFKDEDISVYCTAKWIVDYSQFDSIRTDRFKWISEAVLRDWYPILLRGKEEKSIHLILEIPGPRPFEVRKKGRVNCTLEVLTDAQNEWMEVDEFQMEIFDRLYDKNTSLSVYRYQQSPPVDFDI